MRGSFYKFFMVDKKTHITLRYVTVSSLDTYIYLKKLRQLYDWVGSLLLGFMCVCVCTCIFVYVQPCENKYICGGRNIVSFSPFLFFLVVLYARNFFMYGKCNQLYRIFATIADYVG